MNYLPPEAVLAIARLIAEQCIDDLLAESERQSNEEKKDHIAH